MADKLEEVFKRPGHQKGISFLLLPERIVGNLAVIMAGVEHRFIRQFLELIQAMEEVLRARIGKIAAADRLGKKGSNSARRIGDRLRE